MRQIRVWAGWALILASTSPIPAPAQGGPTDDLDRLVQQALAGNPDVASALARVEAARARPAQVGSLPDPSFAAKVIRFRDRGVGVRSEGETWYMLSQDVPFPGKLGLRSEVARREADRTGWEYETVRLDLIEAVRLVYYRWLHATLLEEVASANQALVERASGIARARYEVGSAPQSELLLSGVEHARIANDLAEFRRMRRSAAAELDALLGRPAGLDATSPDEPETAPLEAELAVDSLVTLALSLRPELAAAQATASRDTVALRLARKAYLPDLTLGAEYWVGEGENPSPAPDERYVLDVGLTIPWLWRGKHDAGVREARAQVTASRYALEDAANRVRREVEAAAADVEAAARQVRNFEASILPRATLNLESSTEAYRTDRGGFLALIDAQRSLNDLRIAYHTARVELLAARARLARAVGEPPGRDARDRDGTPRPVQGTISSATEGRP